MMRSQLPLHFVVLFFIYFVIKDILELKVGKKLAFAILIINGFVVASFVSYLVCISGIN